jgi:hypothetical protein
VLSGFLCLPGYGKDVVSDVDRHVLLSQARQLERRRYGVRFVVVVDIQPIQQGVKLRSISHLKVIGNRRLNRNVFTLGGGCRPVGSDDMLGCLTRRRRSGRREWNNRWRNSG